MGKSPKPLSFLVCPLLVQDEATKAQMDALEAQGHNVVYMNDSIYLVDIILSPNAWRAFDLKYLDLAIKSARSVKYGKTKKSTTAKTKSKGKKSPGHRKTDNEVDAAQLRIDDTSNEGGLMAGGSGSRE